MYTYKHLKGFQDRCNRVVKDKISGLSDRCLNGTRTCKNTPNLFSVLYIPFLIRETLRGN